MSFAGGSVFLKNYTPAADIAVTAVCYVIFVLMLFSYIRRTKSYRIFRVIVPTLVGASLSNIAFHTLASRSGLGLPALGFHWLNHFGLLLVFYLFVLYICEVTSMTVSHRKMVSRLALFLLIIAAGADVFVSFLGRAVTDSDLSAMNYSNWIFMGAYIIFAVSCILLMRAVQRRLYHRVMMGFYGSVILSFALILIQGLVSQASFTCLSFLFPVVAMFYIMHATPYDPEMGTIDGSAMEDVVRDFHDKNKPFVYLSVFLPSLDTEEARFPDSIRALIRQITTRYFRNALLFRVGKGHMVMLILKKKNPDYERRIEKVLEAFRDQQRIYRTDYRIVIGESMDVLSRKNEYVPLIRNVQRLMRDETVHRVTMDDLKAHDRSNYILHQLEDIYKTHNLDDKRVLVYCQPVFNLKTGQYDTAEALMRLMLDDIGLVMPDQFIYLAEMYGYIHVLTEIILHKTCEAIRRLNATGYYIGRISVNVSMLELKDEHFCDDISNIIARSGISGNKVAIELTESQNESDFNVMKAKIEELKQKGITFYLDDFGTGYSNMERIMELPFDIIKFDRSMVLSSSANERSEKIVANLAGLFSSLNYSVLYEGVETDQDEDLCRDMSASYLQGYKYSRPIPIADLKKYVPSKSRAG